MSRSHKKTPIFGIASGSEAWCKGKWHRRYRASQKRLIAREGDNHVPRSHREKSNPWSMNKDGKRYWSQKGEWVRHMRK